MNFPRTKGLLPLILTGALSGFVNGFFGTGGGTVILLFSLWEGKRRGNDERTSFAQTLAAVFVFSLCSLGIYLSKGHIESPLLLPYILPAIPGGILGAFLLDRAPSAITKKLFSALLVISGAVMLLR